MTRRGLFQFLAAACVARAVPVAPIRPQLLLDELVDYPSAVRGLYQYPQFSFAREFQRSLNEMAAQVTALHGYVQPDGSCDWYVDRVGQPAWRPAEERRA